MKRVLGFSGGIDSQAAYCWLADRYPAEDIILQNSQAGRNENGITVNFVQFFHDTVHPVIECVPIVGDMWITPGLAETKGLNSNQELTFGLLAKIKGRFPSRRAQFCTEILKLAPMRRWSTVHLADVDYERYSGVRADESETRKNRKAREWDDYFDCWINNPLIDWNKQQCFDFVAAHGQPVNPLYKMGFGRVGCAPCVNSSKEDIANWADRFPEMIDKVDKWERESGKTFFGPIMPKGHYGFIREVVEWAKTSRGGRQYNMLKVFQPTESCSSKYGLCE